MSKPDYVSMERLADIAGVSDFALRRNVRSLLKMLGMEDLNIVSFATKMSQANGNPRRRKSA